MFEIVNFIEKTLKLNMNMRVELQNDLTGEGFSKQLSDFYIGKSPAETSSGYITIPANCYLTNSKTQIIEWCSQTLLKVTKIINQTS